MLRKKILCLLILMLVVIVSLGAYLRFVYLPKQERGRTEQRIRPLMDAGLTREEALPFDEAHKGWAIDNEYNKTVIDFASFLKKYPLTTYALFKLTESLSLTMNSLRHAEPVISGIVTGDQKGRDFVLSYPELILDDGINETDAILMLFHIDMPILTPYIIKNVGDQADRIITLRLLHPNILSKTLTEDQAIEFLEKLIEKIKEQEDRLFALDELIPHITKPLTEEQAYYLIEKWYPSLFKACKEKGVPVVLGDVDEDGFINYEEIFGPYSSLLEVLLPNPVMRYSVGKFPLDALKRLKVLEKDYTMDEFEKGVIDYIFNLSRAEVVSPEVLKFVPEDYRDKVVLALQNEVINKILADENVSSDEAKALTYLSPFSGKTQRERIEFGLDEASLQQLLILSDHPDKQFARYAVEQKLCIEDHKLEPLEIQFLANPSRENTVKLREHYLKLLEELKVSPYIELGNEWRRLPEFADDTIATETTEDMVYLALIASNPEVKEAFELMIKGGTPDPRDFAYAVPNWNTELQVLYWLAKQNEFKRDDTMAQAVTMSNGLWVTMGDDQVREAVYKDTSDLLNFFREANEIQKARGYYQLEDYPLEAKVALAWTGNEAVYKGPHSLSGVDRGKLGGEIKATIEDYKWDTVSIQTLREMREFMFNMGWVKDDSDEVNKLIESYFYDTRTHWDNPLDARNLGNLKPERGKNAWTWNADLVWEYFKKTGRGVGVCVDNMAFVDTLNKSIGISSLPLTSIWGKNGTTGGHSYIVYYKPSKVVWKAYSRHMEGNRIDNLPPQHEAMIYLFRPPVNQIKYLVWYPELSKGNPHGNGYYFEKTTFENIRDRFTEGVYTPNLKSWIL